MIDNEDEGQFLNYNNNGVRGSIFNFLLFLSVFTMVLIILAGIRREYEHAKNKEEIIEMIQPYPPLRGDIEIKDILEQESVNHDDVIFVKVKTRRYSNNRVSSR